jgi:hypothetical protein
VKRPRIDLQSAAEDTDARKRVLRHRPASGVKRYEVSPEDVLASLRMLLLYLPEDEGCRALQGRGNEWARRLLNVQYYTSPDGEKRWLLDHAWSERLELFGIDPETLKIVDLQRFGLVWSDLKRGNGVKKHRQRLRVNRLEEAEPITPLVQFVAQSE